MPMRELVSSARLRWSRHGRRRTPHWELRSTIPRTGSWALSNRISSARAPAFGQRWRSIRVASPPIAGSCVRATTSVIGKSAFGSGATSRARAWRAKKRRSPVPRRTSWVHCLIGRCREVPAVDTANQAARWFLVLALDWSGAFEECVAASEQYTRRFGSDGEVELWAAAAYDCLGDTAAARTHFDNVLRLIPAATNTYHHVIVAYFYRRRGDRAKAERIARQAVASLTSSDRPDGELEAYPYHVLLGNRVQIERLSADGQAWPAEAYASFGDMEEARRAIRAALDSPMLPWMFGFEAQRDLNRPRRLLEEPLWREYVARRIAVRERALAEY